MPEKESKSTKSLYFCQGSPGALPILCLAAEFYPDYRSVFTEAAIKIGM
jgi:hypothetical protein